MTRNATGWLHFTQQRREPALLLVCFPCAGGSALTFSPWSSQLSDRVELAAVQLPGRDTRSHEPFVSRIETVVEHVVRALCERGCTRVAHFEHSMGALLTFEVARKLVAHRQVTILNLIVAGRTAPHHLHPREMLHRLDDRTLVAKLRVLSGTPDVVLESAETIRCFLPRVRADLLLDESYAFSKLVVPTVSHNLQWRARTTPMHHRRMWPHGVS